MSATTAFDFSCIFFYFSNHQDHHDGIVLMGMWIFSASSICNLLQPLEMRLSNFCSNSNWDWCQAPWAICLHKYGRRNRESKSKLSHISVFHPQHREHPPTYLVCQKPADFNQKYTWLPSQPKGWGNWITCYGFKWSFNWKTIRANWKRFLPSALISSHFIQTAISSHHEGLDLEVHFTVKMYFILHLHTAPRWRNLLSSLCSSINVDLSICHKSVLKCTQFWRVLLHYNTDEQQMPAHYGSRCWVWKRKFSLLKSSWILCSYEGNVPDEISSDPL